MKKRVLITSMLLVIMAVAIGCKESTKIEAAYISEITQAGSQNYGVRITYADDSRLDGKYVDTQIKFSRKGEVTIWREGEEKFTYQILDSDTWYSMTTIMYEAKGKSGQEEFEQKDDAVAKVYLFNSSQSQNITFRVVCGMTEENSSRTGQILVGSESISDHFTLKIKK